MKESSIFLCPSSLNPILEIQVPMYVSIETRVLRYYPGGGGLSTMEPPAVLSFPHPHFRQCLKWWFLCSLSGDLTSWLYLQLPRSTLCKHTQLGSCWTGAVNEALVIQELGATTTTGDSTEHKDVRLPKVPHYCCQLSTEVGTSPWVDGTPGIIALQRGGIQLYAQLAQPGSVKQQVPQG